MKKDWYKLACLALSAVVFSSVQSCSDDDEGKKETTNVEDNSLKYFATTDMTWAEFYSGELEKPASAIESEYDGVTSATPKVLRFTGMVVDSTSCTGVKAVNVAMTESVYKSLKDKSRFTFLNDTTFTKYKQLDKNGNFGKMVSNSVTVSPSSVSLTCGFDAKFAQYVLSLRDIDLASLKDSTGTFANLMGGVITTTDGLKFGLVPLNNLWLNASEVGFSISAFTEVHGNKVAYEHTALLEGKTIKNITYMVKNADDISVDVDVFVKKQTSATAIVDAVVKDTDVEVKISLKDVPSDANYQLGTVKFGSGRQAKALDASAYTYTNGVLTLKGSVEAGSYSFSLVDSKYVTVGGTFEVSE